MDKLFEKIDQTEENQLYQELAPLYDFIYSRHYNYDEQLQVIKEYSPSPANSILEGACGTGRLLDLLETEEKYTTVAGFDLNEGMLSLARDRVNSISIEQAGFTHFSFDYSFDVIVVLGNSISHLLGDQDMIEFMKTAEAHLSPNGRLVFDYMEPPLLNGKTQTETFESDTYEVNRTSLSTLESPNKGRFNFAYEVLNKHTDEQFITGESVQVRSYTPDSLKSFAEKAGLTPRIINWDSPYSDSRSVEDNIFIGEK